MNDTSSVIVDLFTKVKHGMSNNCHVALHEHCHYELARRDYIDSFLKKRGNKLRTFKIGGTKIEKIVIILQKAYLTIKILKRTRNNIHVS